MINDLTSAEFLHIYGLLRREETRCIALKNAGQYALVKDDLKLTGSILQKLETKHPELLQLLPR